MPGIAAKSRRSRGMAMLLVLSVIGMASVLGLGMLSTASIQAATARNSLDAVRADSSVRSGIQVACYYLQYPRRAPSLTNGYWPGGVVNLGDGETVQVSVSSLGGNDYRITATSTGSGVQRSSRCSIHVEPGFKLKYAAVFNGNSVSVPGFVSLYGGAQVAGLLVNYGAISEQSCAASVLNYGFMSGGWVPLTTGNTASNPRPDKRHDYRTYRYQGQTYLAKNISVSSTSSVALRPTADNPAGVFRRNGSLTLNGGVTVQGTLLVEGSLNIYGSGNSISGPAAGFPALVVKDDIYTYGAFRELRVEGLTWLGKSIRFNGMNLFSLLEFRGVLLFGGEGSIQNVVGPTVRVYYEPGRADGVQIDDSIPPPSVTMTSYQ